MRWLWLEKLNRAAMVLIGISVSLSHRSASASRKLMRY
ncbi:hypothetical protein CES85_4170 [Ochrobactrum quorumnocens]|uniref:Uncharacterized protein n=1 Tax=Ochrobactrum quorumnocens TaxID=271865 RepID=A0A248UAF2_9HYPH|nr:hypothetical protein CES85_4170 [[Ochrobactrum] quorumnocens]